MPGASTATAPKVLQGGDHITAWLNNSTGGITLEKQNPDSTEVTIMVEQRTPSEELTARLHEVFALQLATTVGFHALLLPDGYYVWVKGIEHHAGILGLLDSLYGIRESRGKIQVTHAPNERPVVVVDSEYQDALLTALGIFKALEDDAETARYRVYHSDEVTLRLVDWATVQATTEPMREGKIVQENDTPAVVQGVG